MPSITAGTQQLATWGTGDIVIYAGAIGLVIVGFMCFAARMAIIGFIAVVVGIGIASGGMGIARSVYGYFHSSSLEPDPSRSYASIEPSSTSAPSLLIGSHAYKVLPNGS